MVSGFRVKTKVNQDATSDRRRFLIRDRRYVYQVRQTHRAHRMPASFFADAPSQFAHRFQDGML